MDVGKRIIELREKKKITTNKLANMAGIAQSYLRDVELGKTNPTIEKLEYICDALNITLKDFFDTEYIINDIDNIFSSLTDNQIDALINFIKTLKQL